jgi:hypothetical protein
MYTLMGHQAGIAESATAEQTVIIFLGLFAVLAGCFFF